MNLIILAAVGLGGYWIYTKFIAGGGAPPNTNTSVTQTTASDLASEIAAGRLPSYDATQYAAWAAAIRQAANQYFSGLSDSQTVLQIMDQMDNLADVYSLIQAFGTQEVGGFFGQQMNLGEFISKEFTNSMIDAFNQQLRYNNVSFTWAY